MSLPACRCSGGGRMHACSCAGVPQARPARPARRRGPSTAGRGARRHQPSAATPLPAGLAEGRAGMGGASNEHVSQSASSSYDSERKGGWLPPPLPCSAPQHAKWLNVHLRQRQRTTCTCLPALAPAGQGRGGHMRALVWASSPQPCTLRSASHVHPPHSTPNTK